MDVDPLPSSALGAVIGLLEYLDDIGGQEDVYRVATALRMELDDLLPVLNAGKVLGFFNVSKGDVAMTELGRDFLMSDVNGRKRIVCKQLKKLPLFQDITETLKKRRNKRAPKDYFLELFEKKLPEDEAERLLKTVIDWGRYGELIGYNEDADELYLDEEGQLTC
ncbi:MAG: AAA-associated domain-containing protein [Bacillota bacterium]